MKFINDIFLNIAGAIRHFCAWIGLGSTATDLVMGLVAFVAIILVCVLCALFYVLWERKFAGYIQRRPGPNRLGPNGWFQTVADALKLLMKEDVVPDRADKKLHLTAALVVFAPPMLALAVIPFGEGMVALDLEMGLVYLLAVTSLCTLPILIAGYSSGNKYSLIGGMRAVSQMISYEIPMVFSLVGVVLLAGTCNLSDIVEAQQPLWFVCYQPVMFIVYLICATAECNRAPFDLPEGESELTNGIYTEYSGMRWALFFLAEYCNMFVAAGIATTLFLGGWMGPILPGWVWFLLKTFAIMTLFVWVRWTFPRMRVDHLQSFCWKLLFPLTILNIIVTCVLIYFV